MAIDVWFELFEALKSQPSVKCGVDIEGVGNEKSDELRQDLRHPQVYGISFCFTAKDEFASAWGMLLGSTGRGLHGTQLNYRWAIVEIVLPNGQLLYNVVTDDKQLSIENLDMVRVKHDALELTKMIQFVGATVAIQTHVGCVLNASRTYH